MLTHLCDAARDDETLADSMAVPGMQSRSPPMLLQTPATVPQLSIVQRDPWWSRSLTVHTHPDRTHDYTLLSHLGITDRLSITII